MDDKTAAHVFQVAVKVANAINDSLHPVGLNVVQNNGEAAGQTVFHFHMHIIPRYENDTVNIGWKPGSITDERIKEIKNNPHITEVHNWGEIYKYIHMYNNEINS